MHIQTVKNWYQDINMFANSLYRSYKQVYTDEVIF